MFMDCRLLQHHFSDSLLAYTMVTDVGLKELVALKNLTYLALRGTKVTDTGKDELQKALPKCKIEK